MALTGLTGLEPTNINVTGIATFEQTVGIAGTLTYEDVTNVDSVGLITARNGINVSGGNINVGTGVTIESNGQATFTGIVTASSFKGDGSNLTGIDATQIVTGNTSVQTVDTGSDGHIKFTTEGDERLRITSTGKFGINYAGNPPSEDVMICTAGQASPGGLSLSHLSGGNRYGARLQSISGTNKGLVISELFNSSYSDLAKVNTEFGLKADNTCKTWLCYRSEAGNEGIIDDFNVSSVTDEGTGSFGVYLDRNIHRHGNGWSQSIVFGCYNDGSRQLIAGVGYAPSHGSNNPWWDVEDNGCRVQTQRSTDGTVVDAKVFNMAMFGDTGDLDPT